MANSAAIEEFIFFPQSLQHFGEVMAMSGFSWTFLLHIQQVSSEHLLHDTVLSYFSFWLLSFFSLSLIQIAGLLSVFPLLAVSVFPTHHLFFSTSLALSLVSIVNEFFAPLFLLRLSDGFLKFPCSYYITLFSNFGSSYFFRVRVPFLGLAFL